jgi:hypothetical protein
MKSLGSQTSLLSLRAKVAYMNAEDDELERFSLLVGRNFIERL